MREHAPIIPPKVFPETSKATYMPPDVDDNKSDTLMSSTNTLEIKSKSILQMSPIDMIETGRRETPSAVYEYDLLTKHEVKIGEYVDKVARVERKYSDMFDKLNRDEKS